MFYGLLMIGPVKKVHMIVKWLCFVVASKEFENLSISKKITIHMLQISDIGSNTNCNNNFKFVSPLSFARNYGLKKKKETYREILSR